jgi:hypothetical protein
MSRSRQKSNFVLLVFWFIVRLPRPRMAGVWIGYIA